MEKNNGKVCFVGLLCGIIGFVIGHDWVANEANKRIKTAYQVGYNEAANKAKIESLEEELERVKGIEIQNESEEEA